jgi:hypothetical protein
VTAEENCTAAEPCVVACAANEVPIGAFCSTANGNEAAPVSIRGPRSVVCAPDAGAYRLVVTCARLN